MTREELAVTQRTFKMHIGERMVEVVRDGSGWLVSNGTIFADSWQSVWCPDTKTLLEVQELISGSRTGSYPERLRKKVQIPQGCELRTQEV